MTIRPKDRKLARKLEKSLLKFSDDIHELPGIAEDVDRTTFIAQILESLHRIEYIAAIQKRPISPLRADPKSDIFDPLRAAILHYRDGNRDEAFWLVFLSVYCGKHRSMGWELCRDIYGGKGKSLPWTWARVTANFAGFRKWLNEYHSQITAAGTPAGFSSHRKYESLKVASHRGAAAAIESYIRWIGANRGHQLKIDDAIAHANGDAGEAFDYMYKTMEVISFGRLAKFDYLTMLGKLGFAPITPNSPYLKSATGPLSGASLLFGLPVSASNAKKLETLVIELGDYLDVGMQVMEDSLCNWQKSPGQFVAFRG